MQDEWLEMSYHQNTTSLNLLERLNMEELDVFYINNEENNDWENMD